MSQIAGDPQGVIIGEGASSAVVIPHAFKGHRLLEDAVAGEFHENSRQREDEHKALGNGKLGTRGSLSDIRAQHASLRAALAQDEELGSSYRRDFADRGLLGVYLLFATLALFNLTAVPFIKTFEVVTITYILQNFLQYLASVLALLWPAYVPSPHATAAGHGNANAHASAGTRGGDSGDIGGSASAISATTFASAVKDLQPIIMSSVTFAIALAFACLHSFRVGERWKITFSVQGVFCFLLFIFAILDFPSAARTSGARSGGGAIIFIPILLGLAYAFTERLISVTPRLVLSVMPFAKEGSTFNKEGKDEDRGVESHLVKQARLLAAAATQAMLTTTFFCSTFIQLFPQSFAASEAAALDLKYMMSPPIRSVPPNLVHKFSLYAASGAALIFATSLMFQYLRARRAAHNLAQITDQD